MKKILLTLAMIALVCSSAPAKDHRLVILHLNDTHSHLEPERSGKLAGVGGTVERAVYVDSVRKAEGKRNVMLVHAGDFNQGTPYFSVLKGDVEVELVNALGYDVIALGNHEFDNGLEELARRLGNLKRTRVICANYDFSNTPLAKHVTPYTIIRKGGLKIGMIGFLNDIRSTVAAETAKRLVYINPFDVVEKYAAELRAKGCDLVIVVSHLGYKIGDEPCDDARLAAGTHGIDAIIGGHTHTLFEDQIIVRDLDGDEIPIVQDWHNGYEIGRFEITWED
ncbi:MAG: metallophosphoesterase [Bacteroidales bacterium]|nr:metallophosphoesterase [Bacteroidales bacterium]